LADRLWCRAIEWGMATIEDSVRIKCEMRHSSTSAVVGLRRKLQDDETGPLRIGKC